MWWPCVIFAIVQCFTNHSLQFRMEFSTPKKSDHSPPPHSSAFVILLMVTSSFLLLWVRIQSAFESANPWVLLWQRNIQKIGPKRNRLLNRCLSRTIHSSMVQNSLLGAVTRITELVPPTFLCSFSWQLKSRYEMRPQQGITAARSQDRRWNAVQTCPLLF